MDLITAELVKDVKALDGVNPWRFGKEPELLVEWNAAKHVPGQPQSRDVTPPGGWCAGWRGWVRSAG